MRTLFPKLEEVEEGQGVGVGGFVLFYKNVLYYVLPALLYDILLLA